MISGNSVMHGYSGPLNLIHTRGVSRLEQEHKFGIAFKPSSDGLTFVDDVVVQNECDALAGLVGASRIFERLDENYGTFRRVFRPYDVPGIRVECSGQIVLHILIGRDDAGLPATVYPFRSDTRIQLDIRLIDLENVGATASVFQHLVNSL